MQPRHHWALGHCETPFLLNINHRYRLMLKTTESHKSANPLCLYRNMCQNSETRPCCNDRMTTECSTWTGSLPGIQLTWPGSRIRNSWFRKLCIMCRNTEIKWISSNRASYNPAIRRRPSLFVLSSTMLLNTPPSFWSSVAGLSNSTKRPASRTIYSLCEYKHTHPHHEWVRLTIRS